MHVAGTTPLAEASGTDSDPKTKRDSAAGMSSSQHRAHREGTRDDAAAFLENRFTVPTAAPSI